MIRKSLLLLSAVIFLSGCIKTPLNSSQGPPTPAMLETYHTGAEVDDRVNALLEQMTLDEKIGQMTQVERLCFQEGALRQYFIGSVFSGGGSSPEPNDPQAWINMIAKIQSEALSTRLGIPILYGIDSIHGHATLYGATIFPQQVGLGATRDTDLVHRIGQATALEMAATGIRWNFAPIVAVPQDIRWGRTYESYSEDTTLTAELGAAYIAGLQSIPDSVDPAQGQSIFILATAKHFLGDGGTTFGTSTIRYDLANPDQIYLLDQGDMQLPEDKVRELFLPPYQSAVQAGGQSVMASYNSWNGEKMHGQKFWLTDVLKNELGFEGFIVSDYGGIAQVAPDYYTSVVTSINAGIDMSMVPCDYKEFINIVKKAVNKGDIPIERINDAVRRVLRVKAEMGLFEQPYTDQSLVSTIGSESHRALAQEAVSKSLVLLKNEKNTLPIPKDANLIYVAGVAADDIGIQCGGWTISWQGKTGPIQPGTTILDGILSTVSSDTQVVFSQAAIFDGMADYGIAVVGEVPYAEGYGDKKDLSLSGYDIEIIEQLRDHSRKLIVVILSGRPMIITDQYKEVDAWVAAWLPGTEGQGVVDGLFGVTPFTGKLPYTWPRFNGQLPINKYNSAQLVRCDAPLFPFGFGLGEAGSKPIKWLACQEFED